MPDHVVKHIVPYRDINLVDAFPYKHFNYVSKGYIRKTSMRMGQKFEETIEIINYSYKESDMTNCPAHEIQISGQSRDGIHISFQQFIDENYSILEHLNADGKRAL